MIVKILLGLEKVDQSDNEGRTPLPHAAEVGHGEVVELLLGQGRVNPEKPDTCDRIPLTYASGCRRRCWITPGNLLEG